MSADEYWPHGDKTPPPSGEMPQGAVSIAKTALREIAALDRDTWSATPAGRIARAALDALPPQEGIGAIMLAACTYAGVPGYSPAEVGIIPYDRAVQAAYILDGIVPALVEGRVSVQARTEARDA